MIRALYIAYNTERDKKKEENTFFRVFLTLKAHFSNVNIKLLLNYLITSLPKHFLDRVTGNYYEYGIIILLGFITHIKRILYINNICRFKQFI